MQKQQASSVSKGEEGVGEAEGLVGEGVCDVCKEEEEAREGERTGGMEWERKTA